MFAVSDSVYLLQIARGTYVLGTPLDVGWVPGTLLVALAAWQPEVCTGERRRATKHHHARRTRARQPRAAGLRPFRVTNALAVALASAALVAVLVRLSLTHRASRVNLVSTRVQARTDSLTGLDNRFAFQRALDQALTEPEPHVLLLFDLDGFKNYNDSYGHPAGDALLARLGSRLATVVEADGGAYRIGGDEFCVLAEWPAELPLGPLLERARAALSERGDGFGVGASAGYALLPGEAGDASEAMRVADRRLYAEKTSGRVSALLQSAGVLRRALSECNPEPGVHTDRVVALATQIARSLGLEDEEVERVAIAAELHDIGKIAIPNAILTKPGPLDADEWAYIRRHTLIGERIAQGAPALVGVAALIRSSHERWDGTGYPDGLAGAEIPLGSQIVFVCDAYAAMTSDRPHQPSMSDAEARAELRRNAGTQFSPTVVDAFLAVQPAPVPVTA